MEKIIDIGIYAYINLTFPTFIKSNKILYYRILIKSPIILALHVEWLHTCPHVFNSTRFEEECLSIGVEQAVRTHYCYETEEGIMRRIQYFQSEDYMLQRYKKGNPLYRSSNLLPLEDILRSGIYYYINYYTGGGINLKIKTFERLISTEDYLNCHCTALFEITQCGQRILCKDDMEHTDLPNLVYHDSLPLHGYFRYFRNNQQNFMSSELDCMPEPLN